MKIKAITKTVIRWIGYLISICGLPFIGIIIAGKSNDYSLKKKKTIIILFSIELVLIFALATIGAIMDQESIISIIQTLVPLIIFIAFILFVAFSKSLRSLLLVINKLFLNLLGSIIGSALSSDSTKENSNATKENSNINSNTITKNNVSAKKIADIQVRDGNYLKIYDENALRIATAHLLKEEELMGFSSDYYVTVDSNNYIRTYDSTCKRIATTILSKDEVFQSCVGSVITTRSTNNYTRQYDKNLKKLSARYM